MTSDILKRTSVGAVSTSTLGRTINHHYYHSHCMTNRFTVLDVLPEIHDLSRDVLTREKIEDADLVAAKLLGSRKQREWAVAKIIVEVGIEPSRPLFYWAYEARGLPRNTRNCIRYLGDYLDLLTKEMAYEFTGGNARRSTLGSNARRIAKQVMKLKSLADLLVRYSDAIYTPGKHDFSVPPGRTHRFTAKEVVLTSYVTANLGERIKLASRLSREAVQKDNLYSFGGRWGSRSRVQFHDSSGP